MGEQTDLFYRFGVAVLLGLLVGLQREYTYDVEDKPEERQFGGVRTFALFGLAGASAAYTSELLGSPWAFVSVILILGLFIAASYQVSARKGSLGMTTEVAAVVTTLAGALVFWDQVALAAAITVVTTALLSFKLELHGFVERLTREDILAALKFAIITAIILPVLPDNAIWDREPFDVLNPYKIWLMVVLISGISFLGYVLFKLLGTRRGTSLTGLLGGLVSSTATTLSFSQRSQKGGQLTRPFAMAIIIAWTIMYGRVLVEVAAVYVPLLEEVWLPIAVTAAAALAFALYLYFGPKAADEEDVHVSNPFELRPAVTLGLLYGLILVISRAAQLYFDSTGVYLAAILSGTTDVDAITLSMAELSRADDLELAVAARAIILATMSNTVVKGGIVLGSGSVALRKTVLPGFLLILAVAAAMVFMIR